SLTHSVTLSHLRSTFFAARRPPNRALHSFPTRRSSDLALDYDLPIGSASGAWFLRFALDAVAPGGAARLGLSDPAVRVRPADLQIGRATSELQSRFDLVCRLLLEKKKAIESLRRYPHRR